MRLVAYNIEWFSSLFGNDDQLLLDNEWSGRRDVVRREQIEALAIVFTALDADGVMIVEAPDTTSRRSTKDALLNFAKFAGLRLDAVAHGFANDTQQEIAFLYDSRKLSAKHSPRGSADAASFAPRFDGEFMMDIDVDGVPEQHRFSKPPLEITVEIKGQAKPIHMIGVHVKSKAPHGAKNRKEEVRISIQNRRKQLAQCQWLRRRIDEHLEVDNQLLVLGDFNDGPGLDEYEALFGRSGVEVVMGAHCDADAQLYDPHVEARLNPRETWSPSSARFFQHRKGTFLNALLDYAMVSQNLRKAYAPNWKIWHPFDDAACFAEPELQRALLTASDHFPVSVDLKLT